MKLSQKRSVTRILVAIIATYLVLHYSKRFIYSWQRTYSQRPQFPHDDDAGTIAEADDSQSIREMWEKNANGALANNVLLQEEENYFASYTDGWNGLHLPSYDEWAAPIQASAVAEYSEFQMKRLRSQRICEKSMEIQSLIEFDKFAQRSWNYISDASVTIFNNRKATFYGEKMPRRKKQAKRGYVITLYFPFNK